MAARKKIIQALENILMRKHALRTDLAEPYFSVQASLNLDSSALCFVFSVCSILQSMIIAWLKTHFIWDALNKNCKSRPDSERIMVSQAHVKNSAMKTHLNSSTAETKLRWPAHTRLLQQTVVGGWVKSFPPHPNPSLSQRTPLLRETQRRVSETMAVSLVNGPQHICNFCHQNLLKHIWRSIQDGSGHWDPWNHGAARSVCPWFPGWTCRVESPLLWRCPWATGKMFILSEQAGLPSLRAGRCTVAWSSYRSHPWMLCPVARSPWLWTATGCWWLVALIVQY